MVKFQVLDVYRSKLKEIKLSCRNLNVLFFTLRRLKFFLKAIFYHLKNKIDYDYVVYKKIFLGPKNILCQFEPNFSNNEYQRMYIGWIWLRPVGNLTNINNQSEKGRPFPLSVGEMGDGTQGQRGRGNTKVRFRYDTLYIKQVISFICSAVTIVMVNICSN